MNSNSKENSVFIGEGVSFKGSISAPDEAVIEGQFEGELAVGNLQIGQTGRVTGRIQAQRIEVGTQRAQLEHAVAVLVGQSPSGLRLPGLSEQALATWPPASRSDRSPHSARQARCGGHARPPRCAKIAAASDHPGSGPHLDRKSTRLNSSHIPLSRMPSSA